MNTKKRRCVDVSSKVEDKLFAKGDSNQIKHVLENLLDNAREGNMKRYDTSSNRGSKYNNSR